MLKTLRNKKILLLLALINFLAGIYSISYYFSQIEKINPLLWFFVIDCPLYSILFGLNLFLLSKNIKNPLLILLSIVANVKYGLWTIFVLILPGLFFEFPLFIIGHLLFVIEIIVFCKITSFKLKHFFIVILWFLFNDILDYFFNLHPYFEQEFFSQIMLFSFISTIIIAFTLSIAFSKD